MRLCYCRYLVESRKTDHRLQYHAVQEEAKRGFIYNSLGIIGGMLGQARKLVAS